MKLKLDHDTFETIKAHAEAAYPNECCGFFFGNDSEYREIVLAREVTNSKEGDKSRRFEITPADYREAESFALEKGLDLLGVYHSHPDHPAEPSAYDLEVALPYFSYIIVSVKEGEYEAIRSWQLNDDRQFEEENLEVAEFSTIN
jgi:proteasome lid subunit RPN8/RPN11